MRDEGHSSWHHYDTGRKRHVITLHVQPNARRTEIVGPYGNSLKVKIAAPAVNNKANALLVAFLSDALVVPKSAVTLRSGAAARKKVIEIEGPSEFAVRIRRLC